MHTGPATPPASEIAGELAGWMAGGGILTMMLFPLALPLIALLAITALPLVLLALVGGLAAALVTVPFLLVRRVIRALRSLSISASPACR